MFSFLAPFFRRRDGGTALVDPAQQFLRSYFHSSDLNVAANSWVSRASLGDSGTRSTATNGTVGTASTINGVVAVKATTNTNGYWIRLNGTSENTGMTASATLPAGTSEFMFTMVLQLDGPIQGTVSPAVGGPQSRILNESSNYIGIGVWLNAGVPTITGHMLYGGVYNAVDVISPALGAPFVLQWGIISVAGSLTQVIRLNLGVFSALTLPTSGSIGPYINFHLGYSPNGALYYLPGRVGDVYTTVGAKTLNVHDELAYWAMQKYGIP